MGYEYVKIRAPFLDRKSRDEIRTELLDHVIRGIVKIKDEVYAFATGTYSYTLNHIAYVSTASDIIVDGYLNGKWHTFIYATDYTVSGRILTWVSTKNNPDNGTSFYCTYKYQGTKSGITDENAVSLIYTICEAFGNALDDKYDELAYTKYAASVETATGESLVAIGNLVGCKKIDSVKATGLLNCTFTKTVTPGDPCTFVSGDMFSTQATRSTDSIHFETVTGSNFISGTTGIVGIKAVTAGKSGIVGANTIVVVESSITNLQSVTNNNATSGGSDIESDVDFRSRIPLAAEGKGKSTENAFIYDLTSIAGIDLVKVKNNARGLSTADIWVIADTLPMSGTLKNTVNAAIDSGASLGIDIKLQEPKIINVWVDISVTRTKNSDSGTVFTWCSGETEVYMNGLGLNERIRTQQWFGHLTDNDDIISIDSWKVCETGNPTQLVNNSDEVFRIGCRASPTGSSLSVFSEMERITCTGDFSTGWSVLLGIDSYNSGLSVYMNAITEITAIYNSGGTLIGPTNYCLDTGASFAGMTNWMYLRFYTGCTEYPSNGTPFSVGYKYCGFRASVVNTGAF